MIKFILVVGVMTSNGLQSEVPDVKYHDSAEACYTAGIEHFAERPMLPGAYIMCGSTTTFSDVSYNVQPPAEYK